MLKTASYLDSVTGKHLIKVSLYSGLIAEALELSKHTIDTIRQVALIHDIGKIVVPQSILSKKDRLSYTEYVEIQKHSLYGEEILRNERIIDYIDTPISGEILDQAVLVSKFHHERYDGSGYPFGLKGTEIPIEARIVALADVYDAIGTTKSYKKAWDEQSCQAYIEAGSGYLFDPDVVNAFFQKIDKIIKIKDSIGKSNASFAELLDTMLLSYYLV